ncbi:hypothetical protein POTOM_049771 [Populus tomentosa]|uniref:Uncharacterized protein n=1 Tax=Populus tomentosa TaxID=118781 RepID=A0A8X7Y6J7_POPTO|nr:hypothetical protein POTOM_049771 [Populus tomentosa]
MIPGKFAIPVETTISKGRWGYVGPPCRVKKLPFLELLLAFAYRTYDSMMEKSMVTVTKSGSKVFQLHAVAWDGQGMGVIDIQRQKGDLFFLWLPGKMLAHFSTSALLLDLMAFREQALRLILDLSSTVITLLPHQNSLILHAFMDLFCSFVRVNLFSEKIPRKMMLQMYNLLHAMSRNDSDCDFYHRYRIH